jgi:putative heme-binding domain-containing protein
MKLCWSLLVAVLLLGAAVRAQEPAARAHDLTQGQRLFERQCARCHGLKGAGGEGPSLTRARLRHAADEKALAEVIKDGIVGTEMEGAWQLGDRELGQVAAYVWSLGRTEVAAVPVPGDPAKGKMLFEKGDCTKCHTVRGKGGCLGPDLTEIGARRGPAYLRQSLHEPGTTMPVDANGFLAFLVVQAVTHDGRIVRGLRVNEDTFTIQIRDGEGRIHSFQKRDLAELKREDGGSLMPSYKTTIATADFDDLIAYLASLRGEP